MHGWGVGWLSAELYMKLAAAAGHCDCWPSIFFTAKPSHSRQGISCPKISFFFLEELPTGHPHALKSAASVASSQSVRGKMRLRGTAGSLVAKERGKGD